jgi:NADH:ubiquinone oxidoreductase subunit 4 (subunit M)
MEIMLLGVFTVLDYLGFYIFFEAILIPMFLVIGI